MLAKNIINITILLLIIPNISHAYIDPVSISYIFTIIMSGFIAFIIQLKRINTYIKQLLIKLHITNDNSKEGEEEEKELVEEYIKSDDSNKNN
jgi:hypothetical protein